MGKYVFLDMDGVLCDFVSSVCRLFDVSPDLIVEWKIEKVLGVSTAEMWQRIDEAGHEFWESMEAFSYTEPLIKGITERHSLMHICTSPSFHPSSYSGKVAWLQKHGLYFLPRIMMKNKSMLAGEDRLLIDDSDSNVVQWWAHGGDAILFPQPWNKNRGLLNQPNFCRVNYVLEEMKKQGF